MNLILFREAGKLCNLNSLNALAFDKDTGQPYVVLRTDGLTDLEDPLTCGPTPQVINHFPDNVLTDIDVLPEDSQMKAYIDGVKDMDYVLMFSLGQLNFQDFRIDVRDDIGRIGASTATLGSMGEWRANNHIWKEEPSGRFSHLG